jgi:carboxyl-terminal processing protease
MSDAGPMALTLVGMAGVWSPATAQPAATDPVPVRQASIPDSARSAATFDTAWTRIRDSYYDTSYVGRPWAEARERFRPRAVAAASDAELRRVLQEMLDTIGESHFALIPREVADRLDPADRSADRSGDGVPGDVGVEVRVVEGDVMVVRVERDGPGDAAGIHPGWVLESVDGDGFEEALQALAELEGGPEAAVGRMRVASGAASLLRGEAGDVVRLVLRDGEDRSVELAVPLRESPGELIRMGNLPAMVARVESRRLDLESSCVGLIRLGIWLAPMASAFDRAVQELRDCRGMVVDLRGNPGGLGGMVMGVAGHFVDEVVPLGTMTSRTGEMRFVVNPRRVDPAGNPVAVFAGPVAILVDVLSVSTSEIFAAGLQGIGRARVFGERTTGQALPSVLVRLPNGDILQHAIADFTGPGGVRIEGRGVQPDEEVELTRRGLLEEDDPVLHAALMWMGTVVPE